MKEIIIAEADNSDYLHGELYETSFDTEHHSNCIFTKKRWKGKVKITIESLYSQSHGSGKPGSEVNEVGGSS